MQAIPPSCRLRKIERQSVRMSTRVVMRSETQRRERPLLLPCFYFVEVPLFGAAVVLTYILHFTAVFKTSAISFDPTDVTIALPYTEDRNRTISSVAVYVGTSVAPCTLIAFFECSLLIFGICCKHRLEPPIGSTGCYIGASIRRIIRFIGIYLFGLLVTSALCDILRKRMGILSPHFLDLCDPKPSDTFTFVPKSTVAHVEINSDPLKQGNNYFSDDCSPRSGVSELQEARMNLPSYYSSLATYASVYVLFYLRLVAHRGGPVAASVVTCSALVFPFIFGMLEITENTSHEISVICGWTLGAGIAYLMAHEIISESFVFECRCPRISITRRRWKPNTEASNVFEDIATPRLTMRGYDIAEDDSVVSVSSHREDEGDIQLHDSQQNEMVGSHLTVPGSSPALSKKSHPASEKKDSPHRGHTAERKVIKEFQTYITDTDIRGGLESPRPTQIRELSRGQAQNRKQVFSTFQTTPEIEVHPHQIEDEEVTANITEDLHAHGTTKDDSDVGLGFLSNIYERALIEPRPSSYHGRRMSQSSTSSSIDGNPRAPGFDGRPLSFSFHPRNAMTKESSHGILKQPETTLTYFASDREPDLLRGTTLDSIPLVFAEGERSSAVRKDKDTASESSNLLREIACAPDEYHDGGKLSAGSLSSSGTITDQPSIVV